jgi:hypothetical protein
MSKWLLRTAATVALACGIEAACQGMAQAQPARGKDGHLLPLTGSVTVPVTVRGNTIGTVLGPLALPDASFTLATDPLIAPAEPLYERLYEASMPLHPPWPTPSHRNPEHVGGFVHLDHEQANAVVPVNISGNAIALGGPANADAGNATASGAAPSPVDTSGYNGFASGNQTAADVDAPVAVTGNALAVAGNAHSTGDSSTSAYSGGPISTEGRRGRASGNVIELAVTPILRVTGTHTQVLGLASSDGHSSVNSGAGGSDSSTRGADPLSGNVIRPSLPPLELGIDDSVTQHADR